MYAGSVVEERDSATLYDDPLHPYTAALVQARPDVTAASDRLPAIPGLALSGFEVPPGCAFADRCAYAQDPCRTGTLELDVTPEGRVRCLRAHELRGHLLGGQPACTEVPR